MSQLKSLRDDVARAQGANAYNANAHSAEAPGGQSDDLLAYVLGAKKAVEHEEQQRAQQEQLQRSAIQAQRDAEAAKELDVLVNAEIKGNAGKNVIKFSLPKTYSLASRETVLKRIVTTFDGKARIFGILLNAKWNEYYFVQASANRFEFPCNRSRGAETYAETFVIDLGNIIKEGKCVDWKDIEEICKK